MPRRARIIKNKPAPAAKQTVGQSQNQTAESQNKQKSDRMKKSWKKRKGKKLAMV